MNYYTQAKHIQLYVERWLNAPIKLTDGTVKQPNGKGTPQGGVISPVLANIFLDIVFDKWVSKISPDTPFERYADDIVIHCRNIKEALRLLEKIRNRRSKAGDVKQKCQKSETEKAESSEALILRRMKS